MNGWMRLKLPEKEPKVGIPATGQSVVLYCCPHDWRHNWDTPWRSDIGCLRVETETDTIPVWNSVLGPHSSFDGTKLEDILKDYVVCFAEVPPLDAERFPSDGWMKVELSEGQEPEIPLHGQSVILYLLPHDRNQSSETDIGSLYIGYESEEAKEADALFWESVFGIQSGFDGTKLEDILKDYVVCFAEVPPLELGRFPSTLGISYEQRETNYRVHIKRVLDDLK